VLVAGWGAAVTPDTAARFADAAGWPILADPLSGIRVGASAISTYDSLLRVDDFAAAHRPDLVLRVGAPLTSKVATRWLAPDVPQLVVDPERSWLDPRRAASDLIAADADELLAAVTDALAALPGAGAADGTSMWRSSWVDAERRARAALDDVLDGSEELSEPRVARDLVRELPAGTTLLVASSMPVRDVESFAAARSGVRFLANRGVNGIDGFTSTVLGAAAVTEGPVVALTGDLCFLHDTNGLLNARDRGLDATFVVVDNDGGGIFHFLPYADGTDQFETLFGTPQGVDLAALAAVHRIPVVEVEKASALTAAVDAAIAAGGVRVVLVRTARADNVTRHRDAWAAVAAALHPM
jgi:2-succinyl-5-enolpyruvyl-6-hydroxy-3-cyclohexene-1-carboxylate synthase